jgi:hypothetical protein
MSRLIFELSGLPHDNTSGLCLDPNWLLHNASAVSLKNPGATPEPKREDLPCFRIDVARNLL